MCFTLFWGEYQDVTEEETIETTKYIHGAKRKKKKKRSEKEFTENLYKQMYDITFTIVRQMLLSL